MTLISDTHQKLDVLQVGIEILSISNNANDLCRRAALSEIMNGNCRGVSVYLLDQRSALVQVASYGRAHEIGQEEILAWDDNFLANAIRTRQATFEAIDGTFVYALPIQHAAVTTGLLAFVMSCEVQSELLTDKVAEMLSSLVGLFMENKGLSLRSPGTSSAQSGDNEAISIHELTSRQVKILNFIADGLTNGEIAKRVMLSESTVRQETIRIYRTLKCHDRASAIVKARANGVIAGISGAS